VSVLFVYGEEEVFNVNVCFCVLRLKFFGDLRTTEHLSSQPLHFVKSKGT
jgi:hypothetical protein